MKKLMCRDSEESQRQKVPAPERRNRSPNQQYADQSPQNFDRELLNRENEPAIVAETLRQSQSIDFDTAKKLEQQVAEMKKHVEACEAKIRQF